MAHDIIVSTVAQIPWQWHEGGHMSMHWGWWLFWVVLFFALAYFAFNPGRGAQGPPPAAPKESADDVLRRRFAEGEIDEEELERRLTTLRQSRGSPSER